jgi:phage tail sheath protein FI
VVSGLEQWITLDDNEYSPDTLLGVHRALMRMAAARGDCFAVLGVSEHYRAADAIAHVRLLKEPAESRTFSFAAVYYPWGLVRERPGATDLSRVTPDGIAVGLIAKRALTRGAWIAPANEPLPNVLTLTPAVSVDEQVALLDARVNTIVQQPRGCVPIDASTLSDDEQLAPINVRRLLSLLRRLALREGATYVFEPNGDAFRRGVQRGFEGWLTRMFERGAFAGATASSAFRVTTDESVNTPQSVDAGRFIVELRVAPSRPMTFLTVRLVQTSDRTAVAEVV